MFARNNCTYCGGGIEDNYPAAGADCASPWYQQPRHHHHHHDNHDNHHHHHSEGGHHHILFQRLQWLCSASQLASLAAACWKRNNASSAIEVSPKKKPDTKMHSTVTMNINTRLWRRSNASSVIEVSLERRQTNQLKHMSAPGRGNNESNSKEVLKPICPGLFDHIQ